MNIGSELTGPNHNAGLPTKNQTDNKILCSLSKLRQYISETNKNMTGISSVKHPD